MVMIPWWSYQQYGDRRVLEESLPAMEHYVEYLGSKAKNDIVSYGLGDWDDIGPGRPGVSKLTPLGVTATATYYEDLHVVAEANRLLGHEAEADALCGAGERVKESVQPHVLRREDGPIRLGQPDGASHAAGHGPLPARRPIQRDRTLG